MGGIGGAQRTDGPANVLEDVCSKEESAPVTSGAVVELQTDCQVWHHP